MQPLVYVPSCGKKNLTLFLLFRGFRPNTRNLCDTVYKDVKAIFGKFFIGWFRCSAVLILSIIHTSVWRLFSVLFV